jgi:hypothetical protein
VDHVGRRGGPDVTGVDIDEATRQGMDEERQVREELRERYGMPRRLPDREDDVLPVGHGSREAAEAYAAADRDVWGYPSTAEQIPVWVTVVDLRPVIAEVEARSARRAQQEGA